MAVIDGDPPCFIFHKWFEATLRAELIESRGVR
jgi:hypothetical protein